MALEKELIYFIKENAKQLNIKVEMLSWPKKYNMNLSDTSVSFSYEGHSYEGRGTASNSNLAVTKAFSEALERFCVDHYKLKNSNGVSIHSSKKQGKLIATNELLERDLFFCHFLTKTKISHLEISAPSILLKSATELVTSFGAKLHLYQMSSYKNHGICIIIDGRHKSKAPFGLILGTSYNSDLNSAIESALHECLRDFASIIENGINAITVDQFNDLHQASPKEHLLLARNLDYANQFLNIITDNKKRFISSPENFNIEINEFELPKPFSKLPLSFYTAQSKDVQGLFFGKSVPEKLNIKRLEQFSGGAVYHADINLLPHPFG